MEFAYKIDLSGTDTYFLTTFFVLCRAFALIFAVFSFLIKLKPILRNLNAENIGININITMSIQYFFTNFFGSFTFLYFNTKSSINNTTNGHINPSKKDFHSMGINSSGSDNPIVLYSNARMPIKNNKTTPIIA